MSDTTSRGIQYPISGDIIRTGVAGEAKLAQDIQVLAATTNTAINQAVDEAKWDKGTITSPQDVLSLSEGIWRVPSNSVADAMTNRPGGPGIGPAVIKVSGPVGQIREIQWSQATNVNQFGRVWEIRFDGHSWSDWRDTGANQLSAGNSVFELPEGLYYTFSASVASTLIGAPTAQEIDGGWYAGPARIEVLGPTGGAREVTWTVLPSVSSNRPVVTFRRWYDGQDWSNWRNDTAQRLWVGFDVRELTSGVYSSVSASMTSSAASRPDTTNPAIIRVTHTGSLRSIDWEELPSRSFAGRTFKMIFDGQDWGPWRESTGGSGSSDPVDVAALASRASEGEQRGLRRILQALHPSTEKPVWAWWAPTGQRLTIPTHDGSGEAMHPSLVHVPDGWNGYAYWMAMTPYPDWNDAHEDPNIVVSHDGTDWVVPPGLTNPLDDAPGAPGTHNSDTHLIIHDGRMIVSWRAVDRADNSRNIFYYSESTDGIIWTPKVEFFRGNRSGSNFRTMVSQSLIPMNGGQWRFYYIHSVVGENTLTYLTGESTDGSVPTSWAAPVDCDLGTRDQIRDPWHMEIVRHDDQWLLVFNDGERDTPGLQGDLFFAMSDDGVAWDTSPLPLVPRLGQDITAQYKAGFIPHGNGDSLTLDLYYSGNRQFAKRQWGTFRTTARPV